MQTSTGTRNSECLIDTLSDELWLDVFARVALQQPNGFRTIAACSAACKSFYRLCQDDSVARAAFMGINQHLSLDPLTGHWPSLAELPPTLPWWHVVKDQVRFMRSWMRCVALQNPRQRLHVAQAEHVPGEVAPMAEPWHASPTILPQPDPATDSTPPADPFSLSNNVADVAQAEAVGSAVDRTGRFSIAEAPFHTTLIDLACPSHLLPETKLDDVHVLNRIDRVHVHVPRADPASPGACVPSGVFAVSANWVPQSRISEQLTSKDVTRIVHILDASTFTPISAHVLEKDAPQPDVLLDDLHNDDDEPRLRYLQAVDAVNQCFVIMSLVANDPEHGTFVASKLHLVSYDPNKPKTEKLVATHTFPGSPDSASLPLQIHNDNTYKLIYSDDSYHFVIRHLRSHNLSIYRPDVTIRTTDMIHHYEPDFASILVTGDQFGAVRVWCTDTGALKYSYQVAHMLTNSFTMLRPWIRPWIVESPQVWARDKWVQVYSLVCGFEWDPEEQPGSSLHSVVRANMQVPATIAPDDPLYQQADWSRFMRLFEEKRDGLAWMGSFTSMRGLATVEEAPKPACLYRGKTAPNSVAYLAAYQALFSMDEQGRLFVTDLVTKKELGTLLAGGCSAQQAVVLAADHKDVFPEVRELVSVDGHVGARIVTLHQATIQPRPSQPPSVSSHLSGDMMFLGSAWNRFLVYRNHSLMVLEQV